MKTCSTKLTVFFTLALILAILPSAWSAGTSNMMGGGTGIGGGMMGGGSMMNEFKAADLNGDGVPEITYIAAGSYLVILDNMGMVKSTKLLPAIPGQTVQLRVSASGIDVADLDGDKIPEIITQYRGFNGTYLVILDNQGNYKSSQKLPVVVY